MKVLKIIGGEFEVDGWSFRLLFGSNKAILVWSFKSLVLNSNNCSLISFTWVLRVLTSVCKSLVVICLKILGVGYWSNIFDKVTGSVLVGFSFLQTISFNFKR